MISCLTRERNGEVESIQVENRGKSLVITVNVDTNCRGDGSTARVKIPKLYGEEIFYDTEENCQKEVSGIIQELSTEKEHRHFYIPLRSEVASYRLGEGIFSKSDTLMDTSTVDTKHYCTDDPYDNDIEGDGSCADLLANGILNDPDLPRIKNMRIGCFTEFWGEDQEKEYDILVKMFTDNKEKFQHLESLFIGEIAPPLADISGQYNGNYGELLKALPNLKSFVMQGIPGQLISNGETLDLPNLEELIIITGGLSGHIIETFKTAKLPNLKKLIIYMGLEHYGLEVAAKDLVALAEKNRFPSLKYLGFVNSEEQNKIVELLLSGDILPQIEVLDISFGCLDDKGAQIILDNVDKLAHLKEILLEWHYVSDKLVAELEKSKLNIKLESPQDQKYLYPMITE
ncbi:MAG: hypothetical protein FWC91_07280 [Defluviitaleaceae bacterium]|nr:hypothetical protein [Defluviitaleaceae bacterium]